MRIGNTGRRGDRLPIVIILVVVIAVLVAVPLVALRALRGRSSQADGADFASESLEQPRMVGERRDPTATAPVSGEDAPAATATVGKTPTSAGVQEERSTPTAALPTPSIGTTPSATPEGDTIFSSALPTPTGVAAVPGVFRTATPQPRAPVLIYPPSGICVAHGPTLRWEGPLGQTYRVILTHESGYAPSTTTGATAWTPDLPGDQFGRWQWQVAVVGGPTSEERFFWFDPLGCDEGGDEGNATLCEPDQTEIILDAFSQGYAEAQVTASGDEVFVDGVIAELHGRMDGVDGDGHVDLLIDEAAVGQPYPVVGSGSWERLASDLHIGGQIYGKHIFWFRVVPSGALVGDEGLEIVACLGLESGVPDEPNTPKPEEPTPTRKPQDPTPTAKPQRPTPTAKPQRPTPTPKATAPATPSG